MEEIKCNKYQKYGKTYYQKNREKIIEESKKYYKEHIEKQREYTKKYNKSHPEIMKKAYNNFTKKHNWSEYCANARRKRVEKLREEGCTNPWAVVTKGAEPKY